jgi:hypothetical protein
MKSALSRKLYAKCQPQQADVSNIFVQGCNQRSSDCRDLIPLSKSSREKSTSSPKGITLAAVAIGAVVFAASPSPFRITAASAQQLQIEPAEASGATALYLTLCLWSEHRPMATCRELPLTPGAAGPVFSSIKACQDGLEEAMGRWRAQAGPVFGYTEMAGDGYRIQNIRCAPVVGKSGDSEQ